MTQYSVTALTKAAAIGCELRLVPGYLAAPETYLPGVSLH